MTTNVAERAAGMLRDERVRADRVLSALLLAHLPFALAVAAMHGTWVLAAVAAPVLSLVPFAVVRACPGTLVSRCVVATAFMGYSMLLIQEAHGATEMHFHVFAALAFLSMYRDWRVPVLAGALIVVHHLAFHLLQAAGAPVWVFPSRHGGLKGLEIVAVHGGFVVFEVAVLIYIARVLAADTRQQAALLVEQDSHQAAMFSLARGLHERDLAAAGALADGGREEEAVTMLRGGIQHVAELVSAIQRTSVGIAAASSEMATGAAETQQASAEISDSITEMASGAQMQVSALETARASVCEIREAGAASAENARRTAAAALDVREVAERGVASAVDATAAAEAVRKASARAAEAIGQLAVKSEQIGAIVETITGIAGQTNLLALNAAIEAARAGESGRGFAVVADEVRKLAEESQQAAATISDIVGEIQSDTRSAVEIVEDGARRSGESATTVGETRNAFERIDAAVREVIQQADEIARATEQISAGAERMQTEMEGISQVAVHASNATEQASAATEQASASTQQVAASAEMLSRSARELQDLVGSFRVGQN
jgi:methyl-accepting chemotaxis protein